MGLAWLDLNESPTELRCYGFLRSTSQKNLPKSKLPLSDKGSLKAFGCIGSTALLSDEEAELRYSGVAIEVFEEHSPSSSVSSQHDLKDAIFIPPRESPPKRVLREWRGRAEREGLDQTLRSTTSVVAGRTGEVLKRQEEIIRGVACSPVSFGEKVVNRIALVTQRMTKVTDRAFQIVQQSFR